MQTEQMEDSKLETISAFYKENILLAYRGIFENNLLAVMSQNIKNAVKDAGLSKRLFRIFVEMAQNISHYSSEQEMSDEGMSGSGVIVLKRYDNYLMFATGNTATNATVAHIQKKADYINKLSKEELREFKRSQFKPEEDGKPDPHIGMIQIAILSGSEIQLSVNELSENESFITIGTKIGLS